MTLEKEQSVKFAFICDDKYILPTCVAITSLVRNKHQESLYHIYIIMADMSEESGKIFQELEEPGVKISIIQASALEFEGMDKTSKNSYCVATKSALLKFKLPLLLPDCDRVIYLDGDLIVTRDLTQLYGVELADNYAAVVQDSGIIYSQDAKKLKFPEYFNSGVMVLNLVKMRAEQICDRLILEKKNGADMTLMDQNIFNLVFANHILTLPIRYNFLYVNLIRAQKRKQFTMKQLNALYHTHYDSLKDILQDAAIIHYSSKDKPWKYDDVPGVDIWNDYYKMSPIAKVFPLKRKHMPVEGKVKRVISLLKTKGIKATYREVVRYMDKHQEKFLFRITCKVIGTCKGMKIWLMSQPYKFPIKTGLNTTENREKKIIVSLTTTPSRIREVSYAIGTMLRQTMKPDRIVLVLSKTEMEGVTLPYWLRKQQECGVEILYREDLGTHTKYYYMLKAEPEQLLITIDDDILYRKNVIELLFQSYQRHPNAVSALRTHLITFDTAGEINPYNTWRQRWSELIDVPSMRLFATGVGGVLYPPHCMHEEVFAREKFMMLCSGQDDLWLKTMQIMNNTPCVLAAKQCSLRYIPNTQKNGRWRTNVINNMNDTAMMNILKEYNLYYGEEDTLLNRVRNDQTPIRNG